MEKNVKRNIEVFNLRSNGLSLRKIASKFGISYERVRQILKSDTSKEPKKRLISEEELYLISVNQAEGRSRNREIARLRDKHTCQDCGFKRTTLEVIKYNKNINGLKGRLKSLDVHHINGMCGKNSRGYDKLNDVSGLITLCHKCHYNRPEHKMKQKTLLKNLTKVLSPTVI